MDAYECYGKFLNGHIDIPADIKKKLKSNQNVKLIILTEENKDEKDKKLEALKELNGLLNDIDDEKTEKFDEIISNKVKFHREGINT